MALSVWRVFPPNPRPILNQCAWTDSVVTPRIWWGLSFPSEPWWRLVCRHTSLEYERRNKGWKVSQMAFTQSFLDWDILWLSFPPRALLSMLTIWSMSWLFGDVRGGPGARFAAVSAHGKRPNQSRTVSGDAVQVREGGRTGEGSNLHLYMNVDACGDAPIDMLRRWHANHRARGCRLSSKVTGRGGQNKHTHTHTCTQGNIYVLLLQITTCTSRHSSDNTQYYANRRLCDSGSNGLADQHTFIPGASPSAAFSLFPKHLVPNSKSSEFALFDL